MLQGRASQYSWTSSIDFSSVFRIMRLRGEFDRPNGAPCTAASVAETALGQAERAPCRPGADDTAAAVPELDVRRCSSCLALSYDGAAATARPSNALQRSDAPSSSRTDSAAQQ